MLESAFYKDRKVLITGHTGFKGSYMCRVLLELGAEVWGYALDPPTEPSLFELCSLSKEIKSVKGDIRDLDSLKRVFEEARPSPLCAPPTKNRWKPMKQM